MKRTLSLFLLLTFLAFSSTTYAEVRSDVELLEELNQDYLDAIAKGPRNEYTKFRDYCTMLLNLPIVTKEIKKSVEHVMDIYDSYFSDLLFICEKYPMFEITNSVLQELNPFLEDFDRYRVGPCFMLFQFGLGDLMYDEDDKELMALVVEHAVKNRMVGDKFKEDQESKDHVNLLLETEKLKAVRKLCGTARDPYLKNVLFNELRHIQRLRDYWDRYTFSLECLEDLKNEDLDPQNPAEEELRDLLQDFSHKIEKIKKDYGEFIGM